MPCSLRSICGARSFSERAHLGEAATCRVAEVTICGVAEMTMFTGLRSWLAGPFAEPTLAAWGAINNPVKNLLWAR
jgi:hypothetical protein